MSRDEGWKIRLLDMQEAAERILDYCENIKNEKHLVSDRKTFDACIRNLQILGDAAKKIPKTIQEEIPAVPWRKIKGMRDVVVHEYFGTSTKIVWQTIERDIPRLKEELKEINHRFQSPVHPWKICPPGETFVKHASIPTHIREGYTVQAHLRREHCREHALSGKNILSHHEVIEISQSFTDLREIISDRFEFKEKAQPFDKIIQGWVKYWNEIFKPKIPLDANTVRALIASESSFDPSAGKGKRGEAKGLVQLMPATIKYLKGEMGELKDHIFEFEDSDVLDPNLNIALGTRWLFRKKETATSRLGREPTWRETISEYKDYLRRKIKNPNVQQRGMTKFDKFMMELEK